MRSRLSALVTLVLFAFCTIPAFAQSDLIQVSLTGILPQAASSSTNGSATCAFQVSGTFSGTLVAESTLDATAWVGANIFQIGSSAAAVSSVSAAGLFFIPCAGSTQWRVRFSSYTSGTAVVTQNIAPAQVSGIPQVITGTVATTVGNFPATQPVSGTVTANAGSGPFPISIASDPCFNNPTTTIPISANTAVTTQLVALSGSTTIYVCEIDFMAAGTTNVTLEYGTGTTCGTGTTALSGAYPLAAQAGMVEGNGAGVVAKTAAGNAFCIVNSAAIQVSGKLTYVQL